MIWYLTNVDTEVLALRTAIEALPDGFPLVRAAQPWTFDLERDLDCAAARRGTSSTGCVRPASIVASRSSPSPAKRCPTRN